MLFQSLDYLLFLPAVALLYWSVPPGGRLAVLGISSALFFASWHPRDLPVLALAIGLSWAGGGWLARRRAAELPLGGARWMVGAAVVLPLLVFKYWNWLAGDVSRAGSALGVDLSLPRVEWALPIGISFFTFQALGYVLDVGRGAAPERSLGRFATYIAFFPQLVAGPILRGPQLLPQLVRTPLLGEHRIGAGLFRIGRGLAKKLLFADVVRLGLVDPVFDDPTAFTTVELLFALYGYSLQIYYDFSGYTDIAIGSARLFGIELPENFRRPYLATSVAGFWRRWHITLSDWVRDYVYFPLGGARGSDLRVYANIMLTLLIIAVWHGAAWTFVLYGALHGAAVGINRWRRKRTGRRPDDPLPGAWAWLWRVALTFHFVVFARLLFRAPDFESVFAFLSSLGNFALAAPRFSPLALGAMLLGYAIHFSPESWQRRSEASFSRFGPVRWAVALVALGVACTLLGTGEQLSFVYYQF